MYDKYLRHNIEDTNELRKFALLGNRDKLNNKLKYLERLAEPEEWIFESEDGNSINVLFYYLIHTFSRCFSQEKINISADESVALFNTGLMTTQGNEIFGMFEKSVYYEGVPGETYYWFLKTFIKDSDREFTSNTLRAPEMATYFDDYNELYFDPTKEIKYDFDHIYDDNLLRLPEYFQTLGKDKAKYIFDGFLNHTIKKIKRNSRIAVPQFYRDEIMFLIPVHGINDELIVLALEKGDSFYRANTVLTLPMAYNCARLLHKPESNWLLIKSEK